MSDTRYLVQSVQGREGDSVTGVFLGRVSSIAEAFALLGEAIQNDQGSDAKCLLYVIRDSEDDDRSWTIIEAV